MGVACRVREEGEGWVGESYPELALLPVLAERFDRKGGIIGAFNNHLRLEPLKLLYARIAFGVELG